MAKARAAKKPPAELPPSFAAVFGEELARVLDVTSWHSGVDLSREYSRLEREVREAIRQEDCYQQAIRERFFPMLQEPTEDLPGRGVYPARHDLLDEIYRGLLFNGGVEVCDGTIHVHDTLPLTVYQLGVSLVSYHGDQGTWCQRLFRRDLRQQHDQPEEELFQLLERRSERSALNHDGPGDPLGELAQRVLLTYAERAVLLRCSQAPWRMGHGHPLPYELLTGGGNLEMMVAGTNVVRELVERHPKFVFVASEPRQRALLTLGQALRPGEFALAQTLCDQVDDWFHQRRFLVDADARLDWDGEPMHPTDWIPRFIDEVASQVVVGLYRASLYAPAQLFYAHVDHADVAAHVVLADSMLQEHRGFPLLIDLGDHVCSAVFGGTLTKLTETAYAEASAPWRYFSERATRNR